MGYRDVRIRKFEFVAKTQIPLVHEKVYGSKKNFQLELRHFYPINAF